MKGHFEEHEISGHTIRIDRTIYIGSGSCVDTAPEAFVLRSDRIVTFVETPQDIDPDRLVEVCAVCPVDALIIIGPDGKQLLP